MTGRPGFSVDPAPMGVGVKAVTGGLVARWVGQQDRGKPSLKKVI